MKDFNYRSLIDLKHEINKTLHKYKNDYDQRFIPVNLYTSSEDDNDSNFQLNINCGDQSDDIDGDEAAHNDGHELENNSVNLDDTANCKDQA